MAKFKLNGKPLSEQMSQRGRVMAFVQKLPYGILTSREELSQKLNISKESSAFMRLPQDVRFRLPDRRAVYGNARTIRDLKKEFSK